MIKFETNSSPFFVANKNYCDTIESKLNTMNLECSGYCNSFGYEIESTWKRNNLTFNLKFHKYQSTQNGVVIPKDANVYAGIEIIVKGLNNKNNVTIGKSLLKRFFTAKKFKDKISSPYFINYNNSPNGNLIDNLIKLIQDNKISKFKLQGGTLVCKIHTPEIDVLGFIKNFEEKIKSWE